MKTIYIDESGYTGYDLLNRQQPFQGASSIDITEDDARALIEKHFPNTKLTELKHGKLSRRKSNWQSLLSIQEDLLSKHMGFSYTCDKRYLLILMFLDSCVEPFFYDQGVNFYEDGQNYALASLLYYTAPTFWGEENFNNLLHSFQEAKKHRTTETVTKLIKQAKSLKGKKLSENILPLSAGYQSCLDEFSESSPDTDAAFIVLFSLISHLEKHIKTKYKIIHDRSNKLNKYNELLNFFINLNSNNTFKCTEITSISFPLRLSRVEQQDSKDRYGIQLADILIGGLIEYSMSQFGVVGKNSYNQAIIKLYNDANIIHLLPTLDFKQSAELRKGSQVGEYIEFISRELSRKP